MAKEKSKKMTKKEEEKLNEKVDKIIEKNFADFHLKTSLRTSSKMPLTLKPLNSIRT